MTGPASPSSAARARLGPVAVGGAALLLAVLSEGDDRWHRWFDFHRSDVAAGQWWQFATGHLMHWSMAHAVLDATAAVLVGTIFAAVLRPAVLVAVSLVAAATVDAGLWFAVPGLERYVGLSGVLHGWFAAGAVAWLLGPRGASRAWGAALSVGLACKLALEAGGHAFWLAGASFPVVVAAHAWGAAGGAVCGLALAVSRSGRGVAVGGSRPR